jgi:predicted site-specific integrase-resolvase
MTHIAIVEQLDGKSTAWMEKVSDEQYGTERAGATVGIRTVFSARLYGSRSKNHKKLIDGMTQAVKEVT